ncbi:MAG: NAD(P)-dependent oxidoreductase [Lachnospiraceae bacterium]|nr:NAD(P)-dependent oxidoreductase [Lachnospiraceae bacterium]
MKRAIVTGPTGAIGLALIRKLKSAGVDVTAIVRPDSPRNKRVRELGVQVAECDLSDLLSLEDVFKEQYSDSQDAVFYHLGWMGTSGAARNDMGLQLENVAYTLDAVELAHLLGCRRFVGVGSQAEYGRVDGVLHAHTPCHPENGYGIGKLAAGQMSRLLCEKLGMEHVWTRVLSVYGSGDADHTLISVLIDTLAKGEVPHCTKGEQIWDYLYADDAAEILHCLGDAKGASGQTFCLGSGSAKPLRDYMEEVRNAVAEVTGKEVPEIICDRPYPEGQVMHLEADVSELIRVIGDVQRVPFKEGIRETVRDRLDRP